MRLGELVKSGLIQPKATEASQKIRNAITAAVPRRKFSCRDQREVLGASVSPSSRASVRSSSAGVTVIGFRSARHGHSAGCGFFVDQAPDMILKLAEARLKLYVQGAAGRQID